MGSLIICMAGLNTRFHDVGFDVPKYLLPWRDTCIVSKSLMSFKKITSLMMCYYLQIKETNTLKTT